MAMKNQVKGKYPVRIQVTDFFLQFRPIDVQGHLPNGVEIHQSYSIDFFVDAKKNQ